MINQAVRGLIFGKITELTNSCLYYLTGHWEIKQDISHKHSNKQKIFCKKNQNSPSDIFNVFLETEICTLKIKLKFN